MKDISVICGIVEEDMMKFYNVCFTLRGYDFKKEKNEESRFISDGGM
jgi:hypothetical protein